MSRTSVVIELNTRDRATERAQLAYQRWEESEKRRKRQLLSVSIFCFAVLAAALVMLATSGCVEKERAPSASFVSLSQEIDQVNELFQKYHDLAAARTCERDVFIAAAKEQGIEITAGMMRRYGQCSRITDHK